MLNWDGWPIISAPWQDNHKIVQRFYVVRDFIVCVSVSTGSPGSWWWVGNRKNIFKLWRCTSIVCIPPALRPKYYQTPGTTFACKALWCPCVKAMKRTRKLWTAKSVRFDSSVTIINWVGLFVFLIPVLDCWGIKKRPCATFEVLRDSWEARLKGFHLYQKHR